MRSTVLAVAVLVALVLGIAAPAVAGPLEEGQTALEKKEWGKAADRFRAVLEKDAKNVAAAVGLAQALIGGRMSDLYLQAEDALHEVLKADPKNRVARRALGEVFLASARAKADNPQMMKFTLEDAKATWQALVAEDPADEAAVTGLAQTLYEGAAFDEAIQVLDEFLAGHSSQGGAHYWKGQIAYVQGLDLYRMAGELTDPAKDAFRKAQVAFAAATSADPKRFDAWMQLGYASQYIGETDQAQKAYEAAMDLDGQSMLPLKGIEALYLYRQGEYPKVLEGLVKGHPGNAAVLFFHGFNRLGAKQWAEAIESLEAFRKAATQPDFAAVHLGLAWEGKGDLDQARAWYEKALAFDPANQVAADGIDRQIRRAHAADAAKNPQAALALLEAYAPLFAMAPENVWVRNNVAFLLRETANPRQGEPSWKPVLEACAKLYEEATALAEAQVRGRESSLPYLTRHSLAGVINDTGLMYFYYPALEDLERAERYYDRALELTDDGYQDAFTNLVALYLKQERWEDLHDLAAACAESLRNADGTENGTGRAMARGVMQRLVDEGKVEKR